MLFLNMVCLTVGLACTRCVGGMATTEGEVTVANSAFFKIGCGAVVEDGGRLALQSSSFSDTSVYGLTSSGLKAWGVQGVEVGCKLPALVMATPETAVRLFRGCPTPPPSPQGVEGSVIANL
jgi:hypothetical protein